MAQKFAVFDIDGTLIRWQLYHAVVDALAKAGHINPDDFAKAKAARIVWKQRVSDSSFKDYENQLVNLHDSSISSITVPEYLSAVHRVFDEYKDQTYTYTRDLIREFKKQGRLLFAISASQIEIVEILAEYYGFDDSGGSEYQIKNGHYTAAKKVLNRERKIDYLHTLVEKHNASFEDSIGIGDSASDIPMLSQVERPIAFNPDKGLFQHAKDNKWPVVVERKNVIYKLGENDGKYILA